MMVLFSTFPKGKPVDWKGYRLHFFTVESDGFNRQRQILSEEEKRSVDAELGRIFNQARSSIDLIRFTPKRIDYQRAFSNGIIDFHVLIGYVRRRENNLDWIFCYCARGELADSLEHIFDDSLMLPIEEVICETDLDQTS